MNKWVTLAGGLFCGGLGGAVFTWYMNHPRPTTLAYSLVTTVTGTDPTGSPLIPVPDLHIYIGKTEISSLYTHFVTITTVDGPQLEQLPLAILFTTNFAMYSHNNVPPSPLHRFDCQQIATGLTCTLGPLSKQKPNQFQLAIATDQSQAPVVTTTNDTVTLIPTEQYLTSTADKSPAPLALTVVTTIGTFLGAVFVIMTVFEIPIKRVLYRIFAK